MDLEIDKIWEGIYKEFSDLGELGNAHDSRRWHESELKKINEQISNFNRGIINSNFIENILSVLAGSICNLNNTIKILDFGGGLGHSYFPLRLNLPDCFKLKYLIIENKSLCKLGKKINKDFEEIFFNSQIKEQKVDLIFAKSSLHYVSNWEQLLKQFRKLSPEYLIISDLPASEIKTFVTSQKYYNYKIPVRFWNINEFLNFMDSLDYKLIYRSKLGGSNHYLKFLKSFEKDYRLEYFSDLVFKKKH